jgi:hypothetical protein
MLDTPSGVAYPTCNVDAKDPAMSSGVGVMIQELLVSAS